MIQPQVMSVAMLSGYFNSEILTGIQVEKK